jgi:RimJ/RimL family protein N-acetyltransferase
LVVAVDAAAAWGPVPIVLEGAHVRLEPLTAAHLRDLFEAAADPEIWQYLPSAPPKTPDELRAWFDSAARDVANHLSVAFATVAIATGRAIGSTRYLDIRRRDRGVEIGSTWLARSAWRTRVNTECKYLLLRHAFDDLGALRVQLKTDDRNQRSKAAIARIGARPEGVLRCDRVLWDGYVRDSAYFSVVHHEWAAVKRALEQKLGIV